MFLSPFHYRLMYPEKLLSHHFCTSDQIESFTLANIEKSVSLFKSLRGDINATSSKEKWESVVDLSRTVLNVQFLSCAVKTVLWCRDLHH